MKNKPAERKCKHETCQKMLPYEKYIVRCKEHWLEYIKSKQTFKLVADED